MSQPLESIVCLLGDVLTSKLNKHDKNIVKRGLIGAAQKTGAKIVCSQDGGMSKLLEDAIASNPKTRESTMIDTRVFAIPNANKEDDYGSLEKYLNELKDINTPVACIVIGGDLKLLESLNHIARNIVNIHFIVLEGSGRSADFLSLTYHSKQDESISNEFETSKFIDIQTNGLSRDDLKAYFKQWKLMKNKITLWSSKKGKGLDTVIEDALYALLQETKIDMNTYVTVTSSWDRYDLAAQVISNISNIQVMHKQVFKNYLMNGLIHNKVEFVSKLMSTDEDHESSLTPKELYDIYKKSVGVDTQDRATDLFMNLFFPVEDAWPDNENLFFSDIGIFVEDLLADTHLNPYSKCDDNGCLLSKVCSKDLFLWALLLNRYELAVLFWTRGENYTCKKSNNIKTWIHTKIKLRSSQILLQLEFPSIRSLKMEDLRKKLGITGGALFASAVLRKLSSRAKDFGDTNLACSMKQNARSFEQHANSIVNRMYAIGGNISQNLIVCIVEEYGNTTPLYIAGNNDLMNFMEQTACQAKLTNIWNGNIVWNTSVVKKFICMFLPFILLPAIKFKSSSNTSDSKTHPESDFKTSRRYYTIFSSRKENRIGLFEAIHSFYSAPAIKFMMSVTFYTIYLLTFSAMIMTDLHDLDDGGVSFLEILIITWTVTFMLEEVRQVIEENQPSVLSKIKLWFSSAGNKFDLIAYMMLILSIGLRFLLPSKWFRWARYFYSLTVIAFWLISMRFLFVHRHIGPKVVMIGRMLTDLVFLFVIFAVVVLSVGIAYTANIYPNSTLDWTTLKRVVFYPYWQVHGELSLDFITGTDTSIECTNDPILYNNGTLPACPVQFDMVTLIAVVYLVLMNIILINVLIAMFSYTFSKVQNKAGKVARFHNYFLVHEYYNMPTLVPPFNVINLLFRLFKRCCSKRSTVFKITLTEKEKMETIYYENEALETCVIASLSMKDVQTVQD